MADLAETPSSGLGRMLREYRFQVPSHQRDYLWTEDEINQLFVDIQEAMSRGDKEYFLGLMVCIPQNDGPLIVLDGQQRLATTVIFLSAVRSWLKLVPGFEDTVRMIRDDFIGRAELGEHTLLPKMNLNSENNPDFQQYIVNDAPLSDVETKLKVTKKNDRNYNLLNAIVLCNNWVRKIADESGDSQKAANALIDMVKYIRDSVRIVRFLVRDDSRAYTIFETLNDRGLDLTTLDLVKNYLFGRVATARPERMRELEDRWAQMMSTLSNVKANDFLKAFWTSRHGRTQKENLFQDLKRHNNTFTKAIDLSVEMLEVGEQYAALDSGDDSIWSAYSDESKETVAALKLLGGVQVYPIILAGLKRFPNREFERLLKLLEVVIVRYQLIGGGRTGRLEIRCARVAKAIYDEEIKSATKAKEELKEVLPPDAEFEHNFQQKEERNNQKAHYLLRKIEIEERRLAYPEGYRELDPGAILTVEHILPKRPSTEWNEAIEADGELAQDYTYRLGNLCLLGKTNRTLGRRGFGQKSKAYAKSNIEITKQLAKIDGWGRSQIEDRQRNMAQRAVQAWRFQ